MVNNSQRLVFGDKKNIRILDGFWRERLSVFEKVTIPDVLDKFEKCGAFNNFKRVRDHKKGYFAGSPFFDGLVAECIRGISDFLVMNYDPALDERLDGYIKLIAEAQDASGGGYLNCFTFAMGAEPFGRNGGNILWHHDLYNLGCLVEAGIHHWEATGKTSLLTVACKFANYAAGVIGPEPGENIVPAHSIAEEACCKLYVFFREHPEVKEKIPVSVKEEQYLKLVKFWLDKRGRHEDRKSYPRYMGEYSQDHVPLEDQGEAVGHAVRGALLYTGIAAYVNITGDEKYAAVARRIWENITRRKIYVTGSIGSVKAEEKFGWEYHLPNATYLETCAGAAMLFFARTMFLNRGGREYIDVLEQVLYNGVLPGVSLDGDKYFYENQLTSTGDIKRWDWHACPCCPPMFLKVMGEFPVYLYASGEDGVYCNLYAPSAGQVFFSGRMVEIEQRTKFPWEGKISLVIKSAPGTSFKIRLRIPPYSQGYTLTVNGASCGGALEDGYAVLEREWKAGDEIILNLELKPFLVAAHPYVKDDLGKTCIQYGPLVYCVEETDNNMESLVVPQNCELKTGASKDFPGFTEICFEDTRYRKVRAIPYFAWANRGQGRMEVWLPTEDYRTRDSGEWGDALYKPYCPNLEENNER
jgi:DUF1680 family protein